MLWCGITSSTCVTSAPTASEPHRSERDERTSDMPGSYPAPLEADSRRAFLGHLRDAVALLKGKATPQELDEYKRLIVNPSDKVARAHRESGRGEKPVSDTERAATAAGEDLRFVGPLRAASAPGGGE